jgi:hypothetical protein
MRERDCLVCLFGCLLDVVTVSSHRFILNDGTELYYNRGVTTAERKRKLAFVPCFA